MEQLPLKKHPTWGGFREGAGRKPKGRRNVPHTARPDHVTRRPAHVTLRGRRSLRSLRGDLAYGALEGAIAAASTPRFRVIHFSVQDDHVHLIVEATDREALIRGVQGMAVRMARAVNHAFRRRGALWSDRYHARDLGSPREVRNAIAYVLLNRRKHAAWARGIDRRSSGRWFDGWSGHAKAPSRPAAPSPSPLATPRTWLASFGWRRCGLIAIDERPGNAARGSPG
jgi:REP element-mobilizing transposase RayT